MRNLKATIQYDGTDYVGWQRQGAGVSIQGLVEEALEPIEGSPVVVHGAGRTDAGVHALAQVATFGLSAAIEPAILVRALNGVLPPQVRVTGVEEMEPLFHARFNATGKIYEYRIINASLVSPFLHRYVWHVAQPLNLEAMREASLGVISEEALRLERLVGDVLDLAKLDAHRFTVLQEEVDMERLSERAYAAFGEEARRRAIDYRLDVLAKPVIVTDGDRVLQIIVNLLSNAFRWTPAGGRIEVELSAEDGSVSVAVADTGPGIDEEERERIFRPFWSRDGGGTGLGLAIARELAVALGGRLELDSTPGKGSRFVLVLPS